jgi:lipopolysaccharide transport system permease protein
VFNRLWTYRDLLISLSRNQFRLRYRQSFLGLAWAILPPLATLGAGALVFHHVVGIQAGRFPYAIVTMAGLVPWTFFANSLTLGVPSIIAAQPLVTRLPFPRAILPLSLVGTSFADLLISLLIFAGFALGYGVGVPVTVAWMLLLIPIEVAFISGVVLLGSAIGAFARDVRLMVPVAVQIWLFLTPVLYPLSTVPKGLRSLYLLNPMTGIVESFRRILVYNTGPEISLLWRTLAGTAVVLVLGWWYFDATEGRFADVL